MVGEIDHWMFAIEKLDQTVIVRSPSPPGIGNVRRANNRCRRSSGREPEGSGLKRHCGRNLGNWCGAPSGPRNSRTGRFSPGEIPEARN